MSAGSDKDLGSGALTPRDATVADAQHTPGPWAMNPVLAQVDAFTVYDAADEPVPVCLLLWPTTHRSENETEANGRLIAAAPELLEALDELLHEDSDKSDEARLLTRIKAKMAIALTQPPAKAGEAKQ